MQRTLNIKTLEESLNSCYIGCNLYGMGVAFFGLNSIVTLSAIACERYIVITSSSCRPAVAKWRITRRQAQKVVELISFIIKRDG